MSGAYEANPIGYIDTQLAYYLPGIDVASLSDERWAEMYVQLADIRKQESERNGKRP